MTDLLAGPLPGPPIPRPRRMIFLLPYVFMLTDNKSHRIPAYSREHDLDQDNGGDPISAFINQISRRFTKITGRRSS